MMRGYVVTILSVSLIVLLVTLAMSLRNAYLGTERALLDPLPLTYAAFLLDDVGYEFNSIVGPQISINASNASTVVCMNDTLHLYNHSADISGYAGFLNTTVAISTSSSITTNFTNISGGMMRLYIDDDYVYANNHTTREILLTRSGGTNATAYAVSVSVAGVRGSVTDMPFSANGTLNVTITYADNNGTSSESGAVAPGVQNIFRVTYANGSSVTVTIGPNGGNPGSLYLAASGTDANISWNAVLPRLSPSEQRGYAYDATVSYAQGRVSKVARIGN